MIRFIPFFYFQQTRLNTKKSFAFHFAYEWIPAIVIVLFERDFSTLSQLLVYYLAFISIYEIGYILNDQSAFYTEGRTRSNKFSLAQLAIAVLIRLIVFVAITLFMEKESNVPWWGWYFALTAIFAAHNLISNPLLKCVTFTQLALLRFLSPVVFLIPATTLAHLVSPAIFNYVLFRTFTYMDSKNLIRFDRNTHTFRIGFYVILIPVSAVQGLFFLSYFPIGLNVYYLFLSLAFLAASELGFAFSKRESI